MQGVVPLFRTETAAGPDRFEEFVRWGCPGGVAGFDAVHEQGYDPSVPWLRIA
jgi:hypothetical protein